MREGFEERKPRLCPGGPHLFGIRHLSPGGAWHLRTFLDQTDPELVLIEGPSDFTDLIGELTDTQVKPPIAVMAYTTELPVRTLLYPFAVYSPEYQALCGPGKMESRPDLWICPPAPFWLFRRRERN